jgi:hypothetical protein
LYAANAVDLFFQGSFSIFPSPQSITERLREEFVLARAALKRSPPVIDLRPALEPATPLTTVEQSVDNESRELILLGEMQAIVGKAGHIFRPTAHSDWGIDGEIEFKDRAGRASGRRLYVQLKSGDSYLVRRHSDGESIFTVKNDRHLEYWAQHAYPVMLVIRKSSGSIAWMDVSAYLKQNKPASRQIVFRGEPLTVKSIQEHAERSQRNLDRD